jgi:ABC transporter substrate binding protein
MTAAPAHEWFQVKGLIAARPTTHVRYRGHTGKHMLVHGSDLPDNFRRAATYADRILKGAKPSELPVQAPIKFELMINLKTAKALGQDVPVQLHHRADEVIE